MDRIAELHKPEPSIWALGGLTPYQLIKRVWGEFDADDIWGHAAELSYYFLLALFPLMLFLVSLLGMLADFGSTLRQDLLSYMQRALPPSAHDVVASTLNEVTRESGAGKLSFGILAALWAASNGMGALVKTLNIAYDVEEGRPWWKARLIAIGLTIALSILTISALTLVLFGGNLAEWVGAKTGVLGPAFLVGWHVVQWPLVLIFMALSFALVYYFAPDVKDQKWYWITPGAVLGLVLWLIGSGAFKLYLAYFDSYSATYGSIAGVIVLMLWFYVTGLAVLIGGEINAEIEHAAAERGRQDAKLPGEKAA